MFDMMWDLYQQQRINEIDSKTDEASRKATDFQERVRYLEDQVNRLTLVSHAMWTLLSQATHLTEQQLIDRVREIDLRDGVEDGKVSRKVSQCQRCRRTVHARHRRCLYCGQPIQAANAFDRV